MAHDVEYYKKRALQERHAARTATDAIAREVHQQLAERYQEAASVSDASLRPSPTCISSPAFPVAAASNDG